MQYFNIQVASQLSGVNSATIRAWEKRYNAVSPERGTNKHRLYSERDIEKLTILLKLTEVGQSIGKIAHLHLEELKIIYLNLMHRPFTEEFHTPALTERIDYKRALRNIEEASKSKRSDVCCHELEKAMKGLTQREFCFFVLRPLFFQSSLSNSDKHFLEMIISSVIKSGLKDHFLKQQKREDLILIFMPHDYFHANGLGASLLCSHYGVKYLLIDHHLSSENLAQIAYDLKCRDILIKIESEKTMEFLDGLSLNLKTPSRIFLLEGLDKFQGSKLQEKKIQSFKNFESFDHYLSKFNHSH